MGFYNSAQNNNSQNNRGARDSRGAPNNNAANNTLKKKPPIKKKKHGCLGCLCGLLVFVLIIGVSGFFVGDYFTVKYFNMGLVDCGKLLSEIKNVNSEKIVRNKYDKTLDLASLENSLKRQLFLKESVELNIDDLVDAIIPKDSGWAVPPANLLNNGLTKTIHMYNDDGITEKTDGIIGFVGDLYKKENIDTLRLKSYTEASHGDYVLTITDKELAAIAYSSIDLLIETFGASLESTLAQYGIKDIKDSISLEQIVFEEVDGTILGAAAKVPKLKFTIGLNIRTVVKSVVMKTVGSDLSIFTDLLLPKRMYLTGEVCLNASADQFNDAIFVNNMDAKGMERVYKLANGITKLTGNPMDLRKTINDAIVGGVGKASSFLDQIIGKKVENHAIKIDLFETIIDYSGLNKDKPETEKLKASDIIQTLYGIVASDSDLAINKDHAYKHQYYDSATNKVVYNAASTATENLVDYKQEFMKEIVSKYMISLDGEDKLSGTADDITFDDLMSLFGIGTVTDGKQLELLDLLDISKLGDVIDLGVEANVNINDRMMGAILNSQITTLVASEGSLSKMEPRLEYVIVSSNDGHNFIEMGLSVKISSLLGDAGAGFGEILSGLIGERIVLIVKMDVTPTTEPDIVGAPPRDFAYLPTEIKYNNLTTNETNTILSTINKFGVEFDVSALLTQLEAPVRDAINNMGSILPIKLMDSSVIEDTSGLDLPTAVELPTVFATIDEMLFKGDEGNKITPDGIRDVLGGIDEVNKTKFDGSDATNFEDFYVTNKAAQDYKKFTGELQSNYYIKSIMNNGIEVPLDFDNLFGEGGIANVGSFKAESFNFSDNSSGLFYDTRAAGDLSPVFTDAEVAALLKDKMGADTAYADLLDIKEFTISDNGILTLIIKLNIASLMGSANLELMPAKDIFLKANIDTTKVLTSENPKKYYETTIAVNNMSVGTYDVLLAMIKHLNSGALNLDLPAKARDIGGMVYEQLDTLTKSMGLTEITFVQNGIQLPGFYDFLRKAIKVDESAQNEDIKGALQGLMEYDESMANDNNYKVSELVYNKVLESEDKSHVVTDIINRSVSITDRYLGTQIAKALKSDDKFILEQANILSGEGVNIEFTFKMDGFDVGSGDLSSIVPKDVYVTVVLPYDNSTGEYGAASFRINRLSSAEQQILLDIIGVEQSDILGLLTDVGDALKQFGGAKYYSKSDSAGFSTKDDYVGYIKYTPKSII